MISRAITFDHLSQRALGREAVQYNFGYLKPARLSSLTALPDVSMINIKQYFLQSIFFDITSSTVYHRGFCTICKYCKGSLDYKCLHTVHKYGINPHMKCSGKNDILSNLGFPRLVKNHQTVLKLADILNRKWQMFNSVCTSR